jgi:purine-binding chemotaxis protein CheW
VHCQSPCEIAILRAHCRPLPEGIRRRRVAPHPQSIASRAVSATHAPSPKNSSSAAPAATSHWVVFTLDGGRYALPLAAVERVVRAAEVTPLPAAPPVILGAISIAGRVLPVFNLRRRFGLSDRPLSPADQFLIARTERRDVVLAVDDSLSVIERPDTEMIGRERIGTDTPHVRGVLALEAGLVLIHDLEQFLSQAESDGLDDAMHAEEQRAR